jgi:hypothetical protein
MRVGITYPLNPNELFALDHSPRDPKDIAPKEDLVKCNICILNEKTFSTPFKQEQYLTL